MSTKNDGGPAFPSHGTMGEMTHDGMTLRDYFAAKAMLGYMGPDYDMDPATRSREAYRLADAMLRAREA